MYFTDQILINSAKAKGRPKLMIFTVRDTALMLLFIHRRGIIKKILKVTKRVMTSLLKVEKRSPNRIRIRPRTR